MGWVGEIEGDLGCHLFPRVGQLRETGPYVRFLQALCLLHQSHSRRGQFMHIDSSPWCISDWVQRRDSNPRPPGYEPGALPTAPLCNENHVGPGVSPELPSFRPRLNRLRSWENDSRHALPKPGTSRVIRACVDTLPTDARFVVGRTLQLRCESGGNQPAGRGRFPGPRGVRQMPARISGVRGLCGSEGRNRTCNRPVNNRVLYQLSYQGMLEPRVGIEPTTCGLQNRRSAS